MQNETPDKIINSISVSEQRIVITKDGDFLDSFMVKNELLQFFSSKFDEIIEKIKVEDMILLTK